MWAHPGKKLLFMGGEFGQESEWSEERSLDWHVLEDPQHAGVQALVRDLNHAYRDEPALWEMDSEPEGFLAGAQQHRRQHRRLLPGVTRPRVVACVCNLSPAPREN